ncbi:MAG: prolipoprotein diacylglyceryl transferase [Deltaproteobacteria bacterium]|jgi:phosphatidylglycerol:prolipoprotein diacylglycerol transferase|nr:prolipoprotein diacylglyceryl transferase [Deltaproteobacteria bacterium]
MDSARLNIWVNPFFDVSFAANPLIYWIGAVIISFFFSIRFAGIYHINRRSIAVAGVCSLLGAFGFNQLFVVLATTSGIFHNSHGALSIAKGGNSIFIALVGGSLISSLYLRYKKVSFLEYADALVPAFALGYIVTRIGCFFNGCCFGVRSDLPWAVRFPEHTMAFFDHWSKGWLRSGDVLSLPVHPTQLYHAAAGFFLFLLLRQCQGKWRGSRVALGIASYGFLRFFLQFVRGDRTPVLGFLDINQIFSLIFLLIAGLLWWRLGRQQKTSKKVIAALPSANTIQSERLQCGQKSELK